MKNIKPSQLKPTPGYVLVEPSEKETKTESGIYLPENDGDKPQHGRVLSCGDNTEELICPVEKGDLVVYKKWGGNDLTIEDKNYQFLKFEDVLATIKEK